MTREEQKASEAKRYYPDDINCYYAFLHGIEWANKHRDNVWHDASEEPRYGEFLLAEEPNEFNVYKLSGQEDNNSWELLVSAMGIIRWAYVSDLLPKYFGNCEQEKK